MFGIILFDHSGVNHFACPVYLSPYAPTISAERHQVVLFQDYLGFGNLLKLHIRLHICWAPRVGLVESYGVPINPQFIVT